MFFILTGTVNRGYFAQKSDIFLDFFLNYCYIELFLFIIRMHNLSALIYYVFQPNVCSCKFSLFLFVLSGQSCPALMQLCPIMIVSGFFPIKCYQWVILALCMTSLPSLSVFKKKFASIHSIR